MFDKFLNKKVGNWPTQRPMHRKPFSTQLPDLGEGVELGDRVWYPMKLLHISYNLFAGTEMLSLSVYEPIAIQILLGGTVPQFGRGVELGVGCGSP